MDAYWFAMLALAALSFWAVFRYCDRQVRLPYLVYTISYIVTTLIGATYIGLSDAGPLWRFTDPTLDMSFISQTNGFLYWFLLYAPLFVPSIAILYLCRQSRKQIKALPTRQSFGDQVDALSFVAVLGLFSLYCLEMLYRHDYLSNILNVLSSSGDYQTLITLRSAMFKTLNANFYGVIYVSLPSLSVVALYQWVRRRSWLWLGLFALSAAEVTFFVLSTVQKGPLFVYALGVFLALASLGVLRAWVMPVFAAAAIVMFTFLETFFIGGWGILQSVALLIFRLSGSYPFYVNLFPKQIPYMDLNFGLGLMGWGVTLDDNLRVFDYMYPSVQWVQGAAAAPAHVRAFAQGGLMPATIVLLLVGLMMVLLVRVRALAVGPIVFTTYIQGLICLYFLTQTSLRGALVEGYGIIYAAIALGTLSITRWVVTMALESVRREVANKLQVRSSASGKNLLR